MNAGSDGRALLLRRVYSAVLGWPDPAPGNEQQSAEQHEDSRLTGGEVRDEHGGRRGLEREEQHGL